MPNRRIILSISLLLSAAIAVAQLPHQVEQRLQRAITPRTEKGPVQCAYRIENGDTVLIAALHDLYVYPKMRFRNRNQERFYWRTVRDVKKTLPYAKALTREMERTDAVMKNMTRREKKKFWKQYEKLLFSQYEMDFRHMTAAQGQMLMLLIDRETQYTSFEVIELYKNTFVANFWQGIAKICGTDLKAQYKEQENYLILERIITLVEAGQL